MRAFGDQERRGPPARATHRLSGVETDLTYAVVNTIRDGKIVRGREYWTKEQALEAAGLQG